MKPSLLLVGLGNPGAQYEQTRHNAGFRALDVLSDAFGVGQWSEKQKYLSCVQEGHVVTAPVFLAKPQTYMNRSGEAVQKLINFFKLDPSQQLIVLCDDVDLPLGELRLRRRGGPGTHNGLKSVVHAIGEDFPRVRIGLGAPPAGVDLTAWVLSALSQEETDAIDGALKELPRMVREFVLDGSKDT